MKSTSTITILAAIATAIVDQSSVFVEAGTNKTLAPTGGVTRESPAPITPFPTEGPPIGVPSVSYIYIQLHIANDGRRPAGHYCVCSMILCMCINVSYTNGQSNVELDV